MSSRRTQKSERSANCYNQRLKASFEDEDFHGLDTCREWKTTEFQKLFSGANLKENEKSNDWSFDGQISSTKTWTTTQSNETNGPMLAKTERSGDRSSRLTVLLWRKRNNPNSTTKATTIWNARLNANCVANPSKENVGWPFTFRLCTKKKRQKRKRKRAKWGKG